MKFNFTTLPCISASLICICLVLQEDELQDAILLVLANKQDSRGALNAQQVCVHEEWGEIERDGDGTWLSLLCHYHDFMLSLLSDCTCLQVSEGLGLPDIKTRQWSIQETSALRGEGLFEGFDWLVTCIKGGEAGGG